MTIYQLTSSNVILLLNEYPLCNVVCTLYSRVETSNIGQRVNPLYTFNFNHLSCEGCIKNSHSTNFLITSHSNIRKSIFSQSLQGSRLRENLSPANILLNHTNIHNQATIREIIITKYPSKQQFTAYSSCEN